LYPGDPSLFVPVDGTNTPSPTHSSCHANCSQQQPNLFCVPGSRVHVSMVNSHTTSNSYSHSSPSGSNATTTSTATLPRNCQEYGTIVQHSNEDNKRLVSFSDVYSVFLQD
jgi:hypothetical protein